MSRLAAIAAFLLAAACGTTSTPQAASHPPSLPVLSASAVPGVPFTTQALTTTDLSKDAAISGLASMLQSWGYVDGAERTFQGESRHLTFVLSRTLQFQDASGAAGYVSFVHANATAFFGVAAVESLDAQGRTGWEFTPSACSCHMANPVEIGLVSGGSTVTSLEINGPDATSTLLVNLLDPTKSVPATS